MENIQDMQKLMETTRNNWNKVEKDQELISCRPALLIPNDGEAPRCFAS